jgi:hypothetical protein
LVVVPTEELPTNTLANATGFAEPASTTFPLQVSWAMAAAVKKKKNVAQKIIFILFYLSPTVYFY